MLIGLDIGTSVVKAVAFDRSGRVLGLESERLTLSSPQPGYFEQDLEEVVGVSATVVGRVVRTCGLAPDLLCLTGQGDGLWLTDAAGRAVRAPISWMDGRAAAVLDEWTERGVTEAVFRRNGNRLFAGSAAPLLATLVRDEPEAVARARTAGTLKDAMFQRLSGLRQTEASDASIPFLNLETRDWDDEVLRLTGLSELRHLLPPVVDQRVPAPVRPEIADRFGLASTTAVFNAPFDLVATAAGASADSSGQSLIVLGTTLGCAVGTDTVDTTGEASGLMVCVPDPAVWLRVMPAMVGTTALDWLLPVLGVNLGSIEGMLMSSFPRAGGVTALPFLSPSGERAPFVDSRARGQFLGMDLNTTSAEMVRAVCEGIAFGARNCLEHAGMGEGPVRLTGGGARSAQWVQIFADVLGRPVLRMVDEQVGARGAVKTALTALEMDHRPQEWTSRYTVCEPDAGLGRLYEESYQNYLETVEEARRSWGRQARLQHSAMQSSDY